MMGRRGKKRDRGQRSPATGKSKEEPFDRKRVKENTRGNLVNTDWDHIGDNGNHLGDGSNHIDDNSNGSVRQDGIILEDSEHFEVEIADDEVIIDCTSKNDVENVNCSGDLSIMKSEIFDSSYEMHQQILPSSPELFLNGLEAVVTNRPCDNLDEADNAVVEVCLDDTDRDGSSFSCQVSAASSGDDATGSVAPLFTLPMDSTNALMTHPMLLPGVTPGVNSAIAHIAKIEPGADGSYVLHLNIPALGGTIPIPTDGITVVDQESGSQAQSQPLEGVVTKSFEVKTSTGYSTASSRLKDNVDSSSDDPIIERTATVHIDSNIDLTANSVEDETDSGKASSDSSGPSDEGIYSNASNENGAGKSPPAEADSTLYLNAHNCVERAEIEKFVICSDGPMECALCSFKTDSYSAFKSHIICSHPCWRITKKLSKNRLLVEKCVKMNTNILNSNAQPPTPVPTQVSPHTAVPPKKPNTTKEKDTQNRDSSSASSCTSRSYEHIPSGLKILPQNSRKRQLLERNKRLFRCMKCMRLFVFEGSIVNHLMDHHGVRKPYECIEVSNDHGQHFGIIYRCPHKNCYVSCASEEELHRHKLERHAQVVYRCQICGYTADSTEAVQAHALRIHQQQSMMYGLND